MWEGQRVSVVLMTYAERDSIRSVIAGFYETGVVDEVLVVNNNAQEGTVEEVEQTPARQVFESRQGYGHASRRGLQEAQGDLIVLAEPDGTFLPSDIFKLLVFSEHCDAVFGTRTTRELIWHGANMEWFLRWGNWAVAKLIEALFNTSHLSDVGCTYRLFRRDLALSIAEQMRIGGNHAGPGDDAPDRHLRSPIRRDPRQLPPPRRHLLGDGQAPDRDRDRNPHDRLDPPIPVEDAAADSSGRSDSASMPPRATRRRDGRDLRPRSPSNTTSRFRRTSWSTTSTSASRSCAATARPVRPSTSGAARASSPRGWRRPDTR